MIIVKNRLITNIHKIKIKALEAEKLIKKNKIKTESITAWCINKTANERAIIWSDANNWYVNSENYHIIIGKKSFILKDITLINEREND